MSALATAAGAGGRGGEVGGDGVGDAAVVILGFSHMRSEMMNLRIETGVSCFRRLQANHRRVILVLTGGLGVGSKETMTEAQFMEDSIVEMGIDRTSILREEVWIASSLHVAAVLVYKASDHSRSLVLHHFHQLARYTIENALFVRQLLQKTVPGLMR